MIYCSKKYTKYIWDIVRKDSAGHKIADIYFHSANAILEVTHFLQGTEQNFLFLLHYSASHL